ncbi:hypothetical protein ACI2JN_25185, partial [Ochrobactrum teleogrylli]|uniref:hypothetical protein n=1 Tax=Ochrobactrum teleogrylli TaxID=2479765 RepID=UPI003850F5F4
NPDQPLGMGAERQHLSHLYLAEDGASLTCQNNIYNRGTFYFKLQHANEFMRLAMEEIGCRIAIHRSLCVNVAVFSSLNSSKSLSAI